MRVTLVFFLFVYLYIKAFIELIVYEIISDVRVLNYFHNATNLNKGLFLRAKELVRRYQVLNSSILSITLCFYKM
jgi:hypothetical protein